MKNKLYLQSRLYNVHDRLASLDLCEEIDRWINQGCLGDMEYCFLPYRDSNGNMSGETGDANLEIFDIDVAAVKACSGIVGYFDGPMYDSGCAFEIGLGFAWGYPVHLVTTDFYTWTVGGGDTYYLGSKLLEHVAEIVAVQGQDPQIEGYREKNVDQLHRAWLQLKKDLSEEYAGEGREHKALEALPVVYDYYLDPNFKYTESGRYLLENIIDYIKMAGKTYIIGDNQNDIEQDLINLRKSGQGIFWADFFEPNVDSSILQGIAYGIGRKPIVYTSNKQKFDSGTAIGWLNLMLYYSASDIVESMEKLKELICRNKMI